MRALLNPSVRRDDEFRGLFSEDEYRHVSAFFAAHPDLSPTPLKSLPSIADALGVAAIDAKDETQRFGVNAFKITGVRYAVEQLDDESSGRGLVCATAGNHGRAVARVAAWKRIPCSVFVPAGKTTEPLEHATRAARIDGMRADGATVVDVDGSYEEAVRRAAAFGAETESCVVSDTSWDGYTQIPRWIMTGYTHILEEVASQWGAPPTLVIVQGGVGGLVCAAASWFASRFGGGRPSFIAVEPDEAACLLASAQARHPVTITSSLETIMSGLRCAEPSPLAWPTIAAGVDAFLTVPDSLVLEMMRTLAGAPGGERLEAGPSGACGMAGLAAIARAPELEGLRSAARLDRFTRALVIVTEGP